MRTTPNYTVRRATEDWLRDGLTGRSPKTVKKNENVLTPSLTAIGGRKLRELTADDVQHGLAVMAEIAHVQLGGARRRDRPACGAL